MKTAKLFSLFVLAGLLFALNTPAYGTATILIVNVDGANEGFNDPTPAAPVGGNPGTTVGQQRLNAFQFAAGVWGSLLDSPVTIYIQSAFNPLTCTATSAVLGSAGTIQIFANFPGREYDSTWYHVALANKLAGADLAPGPNGTSADDIVAQFNSSLNGNPACLGGRGWYYGFDANHGTNIDLVTVLLHEFGHGLGFANFVNEATGSQPLGLTDIYATYTLDTTTGKQWPQMNTAELVASSINSNNVVWTGINVTAAAPSVLQLGSPLLTVNAPSGLGPYRIGTAAFGPVITSPGVTGNLVRALDPADVAGPTTFDACSPLTNAAAIANNIALVDRGTCGFTLKVKNAQDAGAIAVVVADNVAGSPPAGLGGADPTIIIPSARVTLPDGNALKAALGSGTVNVTLGLNPNVRSGANPDGLVLLNAPNPVQPGSSISHWDPIAFPNLLMEPAINADLNPVANDVDLTFEEMVDIGWFSDGDGVPDGRDQCIGSSTDATVIIDGCDSGVPNTVFSTGCRISDQIDDCAAAASNHGGFVSCVAHLTNDLKKAGVITGAQKGAIQSCAGQASIP
ncbi:MAG TPA: PA domain-containing protein [Thermoanaerobaculia bacterium]|jgi:hypothetical protein|nr:PA domain-containing protein [Thermoanaerobaculia bacterium]